ncbi:MAG: PRC-barrel domain-containing protein, partial [Chthoniobacterales bacterium]|nr:PRC-barrel domain-containing protein [Chthoniobacterales bacterium]
MKKSILLGATLAFAGLAVAPSLSQAQSSSTTSTTTTTGYMPTSTIIGSKVRTGNGEEVGEIKDVVLDRNTGCMAYTVLSTGGSGSAGASTSRTTRTTTKTVAVPWSVFTPGTDARTYTVRIDRERIYNAPAWEVSRIDEYSRPDYINSVYGYYGVTPSFGVGAN